MCIAARVKFIHIWIPEIKNYQKVSSHALIWPQGAEKELNNVNVLGGESKDHNSFYAEQSRPEL